MAHMKDNVVSRDMFDAIVADRDHAEKCFNQATSMLEGKSHEIERLKAELAEKEEYRKRLEDDYSRQGLKYRAELEEARNEAATVRRAYLHERQRADHAVETLRNVGASIEADEIAEHAYHGVLAEIVQKRHGE